MCNMGYVLVGVWRACVFVVMCVCVCVCLFVCVCFCVCVNSNMSYLVHVCNCVLSVCLAGWLADCLSVCPSVRPSVRLSVCLSVCMCTWNGVGRFQQSSSHMTIVDACYIETTRPSPLWFEPHMIGTSSCQLLTEVCCFAAARNTKFIQMWKPHYNRIRFKMF